MKDIRKSPRIIDISCLGRQSLAELFSLGATLNCITRAVWDQAIDPAGTDKRFVPNPLSTLWTFVVGHLEDVKTCGSLRGVFAATPFTIGLDSYDEDYGQYFPAGLENTEEFPYSAALKVELFVYYTLRRRPISERCPAFALLITMKGESVPEFPPARAEEIQALLDQLPRSLL
jgi:hypothetical protein